MIGMTDARLAIREAIGFGFEDGELQPVNADDLDRLVEALMPVLAARLRGEAQAEQRQNVATGPYVDRLCRIFQQKPDADDYSAKVLLDFADASAKAALSSTAAPITETDWNMREILSRAAPAPVAGDAVVGVTREDAETFLAQYHAEVWAAAESDEPIVAYDDAGKQLAKAFLARFDATSSIEVTDGMVERACAEWWGSDWGTWTGYQAEMKRAKARRILNAALRTGGGA